VLKHTVIRASFAALTILFAGCASKQVAKPPSTPSGGYYKDDGPAAATPGDVDKVPDAEPRDEPLHRFANRPYNVFGVDYTPMTQRAAFTQRGVASWYGRKFHGQKTAIGETYDMFAMSAAHPTAPLPSYAQVTNPRNGKTVVVRINDRGPFLNGRIVDLSYAAASRIGIVQVAAARSRSICSSHRTTFRRVPPEVQLLQRHQSWRHQCRQLHRRRHQSRQIRP
jgi:rare lipoprotein A